MSREARSSRLSRALCALGQRCLSPRPAVSPQGRQWSSGSSSSPVVELRTYLARPESLGEYLRLTQDSAALRRQLAPGWVGFWTVETGGYVGEIKHLYRYEGGWAQREAGRADMARNQEWSREYLPRVRPLLQQQHSLILVEAAECMEAHARARDALSPEDKAAAPPPGDGLKPVFELRRYELLPGYHSMPVLKQHMLHGLPGRMAAQKCGECVFMGHSEVGLLNVFLELWRYDSTLQCTQARRAARTCKEWQQSIAGIAEVTASFRTEYLRATSFSPAQ